MQVSFTITSKRDDVFRVILSSGEDAFFASEDISSIIDADIEIVEIDLERVKGTNSADADVLSQITESIAKYFKHNSKAILYYYCDDLSEVPMSPRKDGLWPQEYRSMLFSIMFKRYMLRHDMSDILDYTIVIEQGDRPIYMHLIARKDYERYVEAVKGYIISNYGK